MTTEPYKQLVDVYLDDLRGGIALLKVSTKPVEQDEAAERLCRLTRDITFTLGRPSEYTKQYLDLIAKLFLEAAELIRGQSKHLKAFRQHIIHRAEALQSEIGETAKPQYRFEAANQKNGSRHYAQAKGC